MKRLPVLLVALAAVASPLAGCDAFGDDIAATVSGHDISIADVRALAAAQAKGADQDVRSTSESLDGEQSRAALAELIQLRLFSEELDRRGASPSAEDQQAADTALEQLPGLPAKLRTELRSLYADRNALGSALKEGSSAQQTEFTEEEVRKHAEELLATVPPEELDQACAEGIVGLAAGAEQAQQLLDGGTDVNDAAAFAGIGYQSISQDGGPYCASASAVLPEVATAMAGPVGQVRRVDFQSQQGEEATVFLRPTGRRVLTADSPEVLQQAEQDLQQQAQTQAQTDLQLRQNKVLEELFGSADVDIDPRFGRWSATDLVLPPVSPQAPAGQREASPLDATS